MFAEPLSRDELLRLASLASADEIFSWKSPSARVFAAQRGQLSRDRLLDLMVGEPRLIRRPIFVRGRRIVIGLNEPAIRGLVSQDAG